uniref:Serine/threonine-protein phosphatase n=1 Tax=Neospora caninum (strain Liverpool) TaxID=572307 RepID=F0JB72_NEOCL|nr:Serine/threonine protein phosphatase (EC 3.1.3.16), related [Neospora caninum Liverpool]CEL71339.1 TPA: Serine/threonine protein phosphatase, related [Neospora caninum Liverpool]
MESTSLPSPSPEGRGDLIDSREPTRPSSVAELLSEAESLGEDRAPSTRALQAREARGRKAILSPETAERGGLRETAKRELPEEETSAERAVHSAAADAERKGGRRGNKKEGQRARRGEARRRERGEMDVAAQAAKGGETEKSNSCADGEIVVACQREENASNVSEQDGGAHTTWVASSPGSSGAPAAAESRSDARREKDREDNLLLSPWGKSASPCAGSRVEAERVDHCASPRLSFPSVSVPAASSPSASAHSQEKDSLPRYHEGPSPLSTPQDELLSPSGSSRSTRLVRDLEKPSSAEEEQSSSAASPAAASRELPGEAAAGSVSPQSFSREHATPNDAREDSTSEGVCHSPERCLTRGSVHTASAREVAEEALRVPVGGEAATTSVAPLASEGSGSSSAARAEPKIRRGDGGDLDEWIAGFHKKPPEILSEADLWRVCQRIKQLLVEENNVQPVPAPCIVCGDIHGQFFDLLKLFEVGGSVGEQNYIFLGDYVDRGYNSVETFEYLMLLKLKYPRHITLLRGNHESRQITTVYGFYDECVRKYGNANPWKFCTEVFDYLALAAVIDDSVFCVHGGLSPDLKLLDQLRLIYRVQEIPHEGTFGDIVWSDPDDVEEWAENPRGAGWLFGDKVVKRFNHLNGLELIARAHQLAMEGFRYIFPDSSVVTVWSAPNYCYRCGNVAAVMKLDSELRRRMLIFKQTDEHQVATRARAIAPYFL